MGAGASNQQQTGEQQDGAVATGSARGGAADQHKQTANRLRAVAALQKAGAKSPRTQSLDGGNQQAPADDNHSNNGSKRDDAKEDEDDEEEWRREKEKLNAKLRERKEREAAASNGGGSGAGTASAGAPAAGSPSDKSKQAPPSGASLAGGDDKNAPDKKKKKLLNGTNIEYKYPSGSHYVGGFKDGKLHGFGKYHYHPSGDIYEGEWLADMKHGQGTYTYEGGDKYTGEWRAGKKHGKGTYIFQTGDEYIGGWVNDKIHGYGVFTIARNGNRYEGNWQESYRHGQGVLKSGNGDVYTGAWVRGKEEGLGVLTYANGNQYAGEWRGGQMDGKGILVEKGQKHTCEHIAGYLISKVPVADDDPVETDWLAADKLYRQHNKREKEAAAAEQGGGGAGGAGGGGGEEYTKLKVQFDVLEKKYQELLSRKREDPDDDDDTQTNNVSELKQKIVKLKEQRDVEKLRGDDLSSREKVLLAQVQDLEYTNKELRRQVDEGGRGGGGANAREVEALQQRCSELEREVAARKAQSSKNPEDPLELKVKLELAEGELKALRMVREDLQRQREQNMDAQRQIMSLEQRNEELLKEMNMQRQRATNLQAQIQESHTRANEDAASELRELRSELANAQKEIAKCEEKYKAAKKQAKDYEGRVRQADELEAEVQRLRRSGGGGGETASSGGGLAQAGFLASSNADSQKKLEKQSEQIDKLQRQNAELQRRLEELQVEGGGGGDYSPDDKKKKKKKKGKGDDDDAGDAGGEDLAAALEAAKKEKKKAKKAAAERDSLAEQLWNEQMLTRSLKRTIDIVDGRITVAARMRDVIASEGAAKLAIPEDDPTVISNGKKSTYNFDALYGPAAAVEEIAGDYQALIRQVAAGNTASVVAYGVMGSGKTTTLNQLSPLLFNMLADSLPLRDPSLMCSVSCSAIEISCDGIFDLFNPGSTGSDIKFYRDPHGSVIADGANRRGANPQEIAAVFNDASSRRRRQRSHFIFTVHTSTKHKISEFTRTGKLVVADLAGTGSLGAQSDVSAAKYVNSSMMVFCKVLDALAANSGAIPYRDDPLTQALADALGGNSRTLLLTCVGPSADTVHETVAVMDSSLRVMTVSNAPYIAQSVTTGDDVRMRSIVAAAHSDDAAQPTLSEISAQRGQ